MSSQPSSRKDLFGTENIGEDDSDIGTRGHSSQGGTASTHSGGTRGHVAGAQKGAGNPVPGNPAPGNPANEQGSGAMPAHEEPQAPATGGGGHGVSSGLQPGGTSPGGGPGAGLGSIGTGGGSTGGSATGSAKRGGSR